MKKIFTLLLTIVMCLTATTTVFAADTKITASDVQATPSELVYVTVSLENCKEADTLYISLEYDAAVVKEVSSRCQWLIKGDMSDFGATSNDGVWYIEKAKDLNGDICKLAFRVNADAPISKVEVTCKVTVKNDATLLGTYTAKSTIDVVKCKHAYGDWTQEDEKDHKQTCTYCGDEKTEAHKWDEGKVVAEPTATEDGKKVYTCEVCKGTKEEKLPATGPSESESSEPSESESSEPSESESSEPSESESSEPSESESSEPSESESSEPSESESSEPSEDNDCSAKLENESEVADKIELNDEEKAAIANGEKLEVILGFEDKGATATTDEQKAIEKELGDKKIGTFLDIDLTKKIGTIESTVSETTGLIAITFELPDELKNTDKKITRTYSVMRYHDGKVDTLEAKYNAEKGTLTFETDKFSTYAVVYSDATEAPAEGDASGLFYVYLLLGAGIIAVAYKKKARL